MTTCSRPDCDRRLHKDNTSGMCSLHAHDPVYCACDRCARKRDGRPEKPRAAPPAPRPGVKQVEVRGVSITTADPRPPIVSLPMAPWESAA